MTKVITGTLEVPGAVLTYDVHEPETPGEHPPLFIFGSPMAASDFEQLVSHFTDRTVITYDPRGAERSTLTPEGTVTGELHGEDLHHVVEAADSDPSTRSAPAAAQRSPCIGSSSSPRMSARSSRTSRRCPRSSRTARSQSG